MPESSGAFPLGYVTVAFDKEFPPYAPVVLLYQEKLAEKRGLGVRFVPFDIEDKNRISEQRRADLLQSGGFDILLTTMNAYALWGGPEAGKVTAIVGEFAGADKAIVQGNTIKTFNDLRGKAVAYSDSSVSEYLLYYMLRVGGVPVGDVTRFGQENLNQAARRYLTREANGMIGWSSGDLAEAANRPDSTVLMDSDQFRVTMDVVVSGSKALETRRPALQAFHDAWFEATKMTIEQPDKAAQAMARWSKSYTGVGTTKDLPGRPRSVRPGDGAGQPGGHGRPEPARPVRALQGGPGRLALRRAGGAAPPARRRPAHRLRSRLRAQDDR